MLVNSLRVLVLAQIKKKVLQQTKTLFVLLAHTRNLYDRICRLQTQVLKWFCHIVDVTIESHLRQFTWRSLPVQFRT